jgi:hypothetical protein
MSAEVLAATPWPTNAELVLDLVALGYLSSSDRVLDTTYGRGIWWQRWRPDGLVTNDRYRDGADHRFDFRQLGFDDSTFDVVVFDPPYVAKGGRSTSGILDFDDRYGLTAAPRTSEEVQELVDAGLAECARVVRRQGLVLVKCMDYVSSGGLHDGTGRTTSAGIDAGLRLVDRLHHLGTPGPQPQGRRQRHARRNHSTLLVFRKPGRR